MRVSPVVAMAVAEPPEPLAEEPGAEVPAVLIGSWPSPLAGDPAGRVDPVAATGCDVDAAVAASLVLAEDPDRACVSTFARFDPVASPAVDAAAGDTASLS